MNGIWANSSGSGDPEHQRHEKPGTFDVDHVPRNILDSSNVVRLFALEDSAAVLQMKHQGGTDFGTSRELTESIQLACSSGSAWTHQTDFGA